ncbi:MAG: hypothetical protein K9J37_09045 [Saprospiraceae bacterium]|nr:hypothetical protein [Saprospiraceae bacterium]MCF8250048.1 hypothetical protein [Saprospiraceae bacterium]MCF8279510.1 hypothetical protein [Bacteroidales bacterium]MCF8311986.1 hypothetical protein [Saprospiraceae bacterium]MCF8440324.1 hypothetical protein [Saprospiraceae bacterium]
MENSRLLELLRTFSPAELTAFGKFLRSPYHNLREDVVLLFDYFFEKKESKPQSGGQANVFAKQTVFKAIFPKDIFDEKRLAYTLSFLHQLAQNFLVINELEAENDPAFQLRLAKSLRKRGLERHYETTLKKAEITLESQPHRHLDYHYLSHLLHLERYESGARERRTASRHFQELADAGDLFFIANKLRQSCTALMHKAVSEANLRLELLDEVLAQVERQNLTQTPAVGVWYFGYRALSEVEPRAWFVQLREAMRMYVGRFPKAEMREVSTLAVNCCIRQINTRREAGEQAFWLGQVFEIYKEGLDNQVFIENGELSRFTYNNIANAGLGLKAFDWVEDFLTKYKDLLEPRHRETAYLFNLASLHFRKPDYERALELLTQAEFDDVLHNLDARRMLLRIYFDLDEVSALDSLLDSFTIFLRRRRDVGYLRQHYLNLIRFTKKLLQTPAQNQAAREKLRSEITDCKALAEREWLLLKF